MKNFNGKFNLEDLLFCIMDEDQAAIAFDEAFKLFEAAYETKDFSKAIGGVIAVVGGVQQAEKGLEVCEKIDLSDFDKKRWSTAMDVAYHPTKYMKIIDQDILINGVSIFKSMMAALKSWKYGKYGYAGWYIGKILHLATTEERMASANVNATKKGYMTYDMPERPERTEFVLQDPKPFALGRIDEAAEFTQGFYQGADIADLDFNQVFNCVGRNEQLFELFEEVHDKTKKAVEDKNGKEMIEGIMGSIKYIASLQAMTPSICSDIQDVTTWSTFDRMVETIENEETSLKFSYGKVMYNGEDITPELSHAVIETLEKGDIKSYGKLLAETLTQKSDNVIFNF